MTPWERRLLGPFHEGRDSMGTTRDDRTVRNAYDDGTLAAWLRRPADVIAAGEAVAVVETTDGVLELLCAAAGEPRAGGLDLSAAEAAGILEQPLRQGGEPVTAGEPLAALRPLREPA